MFSLYTRKILIFSSVFVPVYLILRGIHLYKKKKIISKITIKNEFILLAFVFYIGAITYNLVIPPIDIGIIDGGTPYINIYIPDEFHANLVPFKTLHAQFVQALQNETDFSLFHLCVNLILFMPLFPLLKLIFNAKEKQLIIACLFTPIIIETVQFFIGRIFDIDDILLNIFGIIISIFVFKVINLLVKRHRRKQL